MVQSKRGSKSKVATVTTAAAAAEGGAGGAQHPAAKLPVTVLSGFLGAGKTTLLKHILHTNHGWRVAVIVNDMAEVNVDADSVSAEIKFVKESLIQMQNGCICCTLREDLLVEVKRLALEGRFDYLLIESSGISEPLQVAETFTFDDETGGVLNEFAQLDTMVTVVDGVNIQRDLKSTESLRDRKWEANDEDARTIPHLLLDQLEFANVIILNKCDLLTEGEKHQVRAVLERINPGARVITSTQGVVEPQSIINTKLFSFDEAKQNPGWLKELRGTHKPETEEYGVSSFVFRARRPFHCSRLHKLLRMTGPKAVFSKVLRAKGTCWLASCMKMSVTWEQAGTLMEMRPGSLWVAAVDEDDREEMNPDDVEHAKTLWEEPHGDRRQEMVFIGTEMATQRPLIEAALRNCLLTDDEYAKGAEKWIRLSDPIGVMVGVDQALSEEEENDDEDDDEEDDEEDHQHHHHHHARGKGAAACSHASHAGHTTKSSDKKGKNGDGRSAKTVVTKTKPSKKRSPSKASPTSTTTSTRQSKRARK